MRIRIWLIVVGIALGFTLPARAQTQITTAVIEGVVVDASGAVLPGVDVEVRNVDTNFTRTLVTDRDGRFVALQLPSGRYTVTFKLSGFATLVQEDVLVTVGESVRLTPSMKVSGVAETVTVSTQSSTVEATRTAAAATLNEKTIETTPILGRKFEDLLTLTPGVSVSAGTRRRRDQLRRPARRVQQHQPRWRRLQQRLLRRADGRAARGHRHHARSGEGVPGRGDRRPGRIRPHRRRRRQRHHQVGHQSSQGQHVLFPAARGADVQGLRWHPADRLSSPAVRWHRRWTGAEGSRVLLLRPRRNPGEPAATEPVGADRHAVLGDQSDAGGQRSADQRQRRLPAAGTAVLLQDPTESG